MAEVIQTQGQNTSILSLGSRLRMLEERYMQLRENVEMVNQNMIDEYKKLIKETKDVNIVLKELKTQINEINKAINHIVKETENFARKDNLKILEKYINMWNPLNFTTEEDVEKAVNWVSMLTRQIKAGEEFEGEVKRILPFGAFVELVPGKE